MKLHTLSAFAVIAALAGASLCIPLAYATDPSPADSAKPAEQEATKENTQGHERATQRPAYLGVHAQRLGLHESRRLGLAPGTGVLIRAVAPDSPASQAGLVSSDVLTRLNDQLLISNEHLLTLMGTLKPGDTVTLHVLRDGESVEFKAELASRPTDRARIDEALPLGPPRIASRFGEIESLLEQLSPPGWAMPADPFGPDADLRDMFEQINRRMAQQRAEMQQMMDRMRQRLHAPGHGHPLGSAMRSVVMVNDGEHILQLTADNQARHLTVKTLEGEVLYDGPLPEDGQVDGLPQAVQEKVDNLLKGNRIEWQAPPGPQQREPAPIA